MEPNTLCTVCVRCGRIVHGAIDFTDVMKPNETGYAPINLLLLTASGASKGAAWVCTASVISTAHLEDKTDWYT